MEKNKVMNLNIPMEYLSLKSLLMYNERIMLEDIKLIENGFF